MLGRLLELDVNGTGIFQSNLFDASDSSLVTALSSFLDMDALPCLPL
jgi:hypothetical protein